jgi:hypothetical protein
MMGSDGSLLRRRSGGWVGDADPHSLPRVIFPGLQTARLRSFFTSSSGSRPTPSFLVLEYPSIIICFADHEKSWKNVVVACSV